ILDGRNRYAACARAGVEPRFETYTGDDPDGYALSVNVNRRSLTKGQAAMVAAKAHRDFFDSKKRGSKGEFAAAIGVSQQRLSFALLVLAHAPDLVDDVISGTEHLDEAYRVARERKKAKQERADHVAELRSVAP